jgi:hypothetical protein
MRVLIIATMAGSINSPIVKPPPTQVNDSSKDVEVFLWTSARLVVLPVFAYECGFLSSHV